MRKIAKTGKLRPYQSGSKQAPLHFSLWNRDFWFWNLHSYFSRSLFLLLFWVSFPNVLAFPPNCGRFSCSITLTSWPVCFSWFPTIAHCILLLHSFIHLCPIFSISSISSYPEYLNIWHSEFRIIEYSSSSRAEQHFVPLLPTNCPLLLPLPSSSH